MKNDKIFSSKRVVIGLVLIIVLSGCTGELDVPENTTKTITTTPITPPIDPPEEPTKNTTANLKLIDAFVTYDSSFTKTVDSGTGYGIGSVFLSNAGAGKGEITELRIFYANSFAGPWTSISDAVSLQGIAISNPYVIDPLATNEELSIRFPIPSGNIDNFIAYRMTINSKNGSILDTSISDVIDKDDMALTKDRPNLIPPPSLGTIRRTHTISPLSVSDNSEIKNITFDVSTASDFSSIDRSIAITSPFWRWQWDTRNTSIEGLDNGSYYLKMTVYDYAGLSNSTSALPFTIDNDYTKPEISNIVGSSIKNGQHIAEVGESFTITATITDSGSIVSSVGEAFIFYKLNDSSTSYFASSMTKSSGDTWIGNIPAAFIDSNALANNLTYNIRAIDDDNNEEQSSDYFVGVNDSTKPNFISHIFEGETLITQNEVIGDEGQTLSISVSVEDKDYVSTVNLIWRERNDTGLLPQYGNWEVFINITGSGDNWNFILPALNVTLDGLEYYFTATDPANNIAYDGTPSSPYRIFVPDEVNPVISVLSTIPGSISEGTDLIVTVSVTDNDKTFSWTGQETGNVELGYRKLGDSVYTYFDMTHANGDSSIGETSIWEGTINGGNFTTIFSPVLIRIRAVDNEGLSDFVDETVYVSSSGTPILQYVVNSVAVSGGSNHILRFEVTNSAGGVDPATATITDIEITLNVNTKLLFIGEPLLIEVNASSGVNPLWENTTGPSEGTNGSKITLDNTINLSKGTSITFDLTYANSSTGFFDVSGLTVNVTIYYIGGYTTLGLITTPGFEPEATIYSSRLYSGRYYIGNWLVTPVYPYAEQGLGWDSETEKPWASPSDYSRNDITSGSVLPYDGFGVTAGSGSFTTDTWKTAANNEGTNNYRMNIDTLVGSVSNSYVWFYAVVQFSGSIPSPTYMYLGSGDESICYINGQIAGQYGTPRGYAETQFQVNSLLIGNNADNYVLFGVHEVGGSYRGGLAFSTDFQVKIFTGPPQAPLESSIMSMISTNISIYDFTTEMVSKTNSPKTERSMIDIYQKIVLI